MLLFVHSGRLFLLKVKFLLLSKDNIAAVRGVYLVYSGIICSMSLFFMCHVKGLCIGVVGDVSIHVILILSNVVSNQHK